MVSDINQVIYFLIALHACLLGGLVVFFFRGLFLVIKWLHVLAEKIGEDLLLLFFWDDLGAELTQFLRLIRFLIIG